MSESLSENELSMKHDTSQEKPKVKTGVITIAEPEKVEKDDNEDDTMEIP